MNRKMLTNCLLALIIATEATLNASLSISNVERKQSCQKQNNEKNKS
jgi:hypothetical protein